jgi:hypothetical protein
VLPEYTLRVKGKEHLKKDAGRTRDEGRATEGRPESKELVSVREKASALVAGLVRATRKPGTSRARIFYSSVGKGVFAYSVYAGDTTKIVREDVSGKRSVGRPVNGRFEVFPQNPLMASTSRRPPAPTHLLTAVSTGDKPLAIVLAGHNGSGKSTLWTTSWRTN